MTTQHTGIGPRSVPSTRQIGVIFGSRDRSVQRSRPVPRNSFPSVTSGPACGPVHPSERIGPAYVVGGPDRSGCQGGAGGRVDGGQ